MAYFTIVAFNYGRGESKESFLHDVQSCCTIKIRSRKGA